MNDQKAATDPVFKYERTGFSFHVYPNRIDIVDKSAFGAVFTGGKRETILLRNVTGVSVAGATRKLKISTSDGKSQDFNLGPKSEDARQAIVELL